MIAQEQTQCPKCKHEYSEQNPPRLLTMCGHTFCQKCIKQSMVKKKANNRYKIVCPLDKMGIQMQNFNAGGFPKNLSVLSMVKKKIQNCLADNRMSNIIKCGSDFGSGKTLQSIQGQLLSHSIILTNDQATTLKSIKYEQKAITQDTCLLHQKPLQLVCTRDYQKICASCVIFGQHRGHTVKNVHEVQQIVKKVHKKLKNYQQEEKICFQKLASKDVTHKLQNMLNTKKNQLSKQISNKFKLLLEEVLYMQRKTMSKLDKKIEEYKLKLHTNLNQKMTVREKYRDWEDNLAEKIDFLESDNQELKIKTALKSDNFVEVSDRNLQLMKSLQKSVYDDGQKIIDNLVLNADIQQIKKSLKQYCKFEDCTNSFLDMTNSRMSQILNEQILLDNIQETSFSVSLMQQAQKLQQSGKLKKAVKWTSMASGIFQNANSRLNRIKSTNKQRTESPNRKNSNLKSNRTLLLGTQKLTTASRFRDIPTKFQQKIQAVMTGQSDILDLTNGQLQNQKVLSILQHIKQSQVTIIKLVRNKLTDQFFIKSLPYLNNAVMLNLSRNELTDKTLQAIIQTRRNGGLSNLKSLMIGQNRIVQRKHKEVFEELKKSGVNVCI